MRDDLTAFCQRGKYCRHEFSRVGGATMKSELYCTAWINNSRWDQERQQTAKRFRLSTNFYTAH